MDRRASDNRLVVNFKPRQPRWCETRQLRDAAKAADKVSYEAFVSFTPRKSRWCEVRQLRDAREEEEDAKHLKHISFSPRTETRKPLVEEVEYKHSDCVTFSPKPRKWRETCVLRDCTIELADSSAKILTSIVPIDTDGASPVRITVRLFEAIPDRRVPFNVRGTFRQKRDRHKRRPDIRQVISYRQIVAAFEDFKTGKVVDAIAPNSKIPNCRVNAAGDTLYPWYDAAYATYLKEWDRRTNPQNTGDECWAELLARKLQKMRWLPAPKKKTTEKAMLAAQPAAKKKRRGGGKKKKQGRW